MAISDKINSALVSESIIVAFRHRPLRLSLFSSFLFILGYSLSATIVVCFLTYSAKDILNSFQETVLFDFTSSEVRT